MRSLHILFLLLAGSFLTAQEPTAVSSKIRSVTVFLSGAQVTRNASTTLEPGSSILAFKNLPSSINPQSIQVEGRGAFTILSVQHTINYLQSPAKTKEVQRLQDSLILLQDQLATEKVMLSACQEQEEFLKANKQIGGSNTGVNINDLKLASDYLKNTLAETGKQKIRINRTIIQLSEKITRINNQLNTLNSTNKPTSEIMVTVSSAARTGAELQISYLVNEAGWAPEYDLRATDISKPVDITYKAGVYQSSGEDWDNVKLSLSTGNPSQGGTKPEIQPWFLDFYQQVYLKKDKSLRSVTAKSEAPAAYAMEEVAVEDAAAGSIADFTTVVEAQTTTEYEIGVPADVPPDGQPHQVEIKKATLPASYAYYCVPKLDPDAFLVARISGWEELNLLSGPMNLYFEGTYVGQSQLDAGSTRDTLEISMGRDKNINVKRERMKDFTSRQVIGGNRKDVRGFEITVRNRKKQDIDLVLEDQLPVSSNKEITVETVDISGASLNKENGKLVWKLKLAPADSKKLKLVYEVKYPKDRQVILE
jgi:uncharacterized protein (TIGR02231 family)